MARCQVGGDAGLRVVRRADLDGLDGEGFGGVLGEHGNKDVVNNFGFSLVGCCYVDEDVAGFEADFGVVGIYDWGH